MKDAHDALHACKKQAALVQDSLNVRTAIGAVVALVLFWGDHTFASTDHTCASPV
jgi:hypothetical protein